MDITHVEVLHDDVVRLQFADGVEKSIDEIAGGWTTAQKSHFSDGGLFDQIYQPGKR